MLTATRFLISLLGGSAIAIGLMMALVGPGPTARFFGDALSVVLGVKAYSGGMVHVNVDSEMRFFAVFFVAYGALLLWLSARLESHQRWVYCAIAVFFFGGVARLFSVASFGWPDPLFVLLMAIEITGPIIVAVLFGLGLRAR